jgi:hypothetical protein
MITPAILLWLAMPATAYQTTGEAEPAYDTYGAPAYDTYDAPQYDTYSAPPATQQSYNTAPRSEPAPAYQAFGESTTNDGTFKEDEITRAVEGFFGQGAEQIALVVQKIFKEQGEPNAYIAGEEIGAAFAVGLRYGRGTMTMKYEPERPIFWQGPSIGFDVGANASKVFILVYRLPDPEFIFRRFPGVEGSLYFVGGVGANYLQTRDVVLAPIRFGAGWRQGISAGYMDFTPEAHLNPF